MICDRIRELIPECLAGRLDPAARQRVIDHVETCSACRSDMAELGVVWRGLETMSEQEPSPALRARFLETLHAYQEGFEEAQRRQVYVAPQKSWRQGFLPARPALQAAFTAMLLFLGVLGGRYLTSGASSGSNEMAQLRTQVESLRQLVALSLLQQQSPSARLRGVNYSNQVTRPDPQIEQELLRTLNHDSNVNVRLSAVDAIGKFAQNPDVRRGLVDSVEMQDSPLVQTALVDLLLELKVAEAAPTLRRLAQQKDTDEMVRQHAALALTRLEASR